MINLPYQPSQSRVKDMINSTQNAFDKLKKDLADKEMQLDLKNKEIARIKQFTQEHPGRRRQMITELAYMIESTRLEVLKII